MPSNQLQTFEFLLSDWLTLLMLLQLEVARKNAVQADTTLALQLATRSLHGTSFKCNAD